MNVSIDVFHNCAATLGEGPLWLARSGELAWLDIESRRLHLTTDSSSRSIELSGTPGAVVASADGQLLLAMDCGFYRLDAQAGSLTLIARAPVADPTLVRMNDGEVDPAGRFWAGTKAHDERRRAAALYRLDSDGSVSEVLQGLRISNGLAWSHDGAALFHIDTPSRAIVRYPFDLATGSLGRGRIHVDTGSYSGWPDGMAMDADGDLWVAFWDGWAARCFSGADGSLVGEIRLPVARPTSCAFGDEKLSRLFITTARTGLSSLELAEQPLAGSVLSVEPGVVGAPTPLAMSVGD